MMMFSSSPVGLNGVGTKAVNALSSRFEVISFREGKFKRAVFVRGKLSEEEDGKVKDQPDGTYVEFTPDSEIFKTYAWHDEFIIKRLQYYCYLNSGLVIEYNGQSFSSKNGLLDLLSAEIGQEPVHYETVHDKGDKIEFAFTHTNTYGESYFSFVNGQYTNDGGTHLSAFREGVLKGINEYAKHNYAGEDVREGMIGRDIDQTPRSGIRKPNQEQAGLGCSHVGRALRQRSGREVAA